MAAVEFHEIERKYTAPLRRAVPRLDGLPGVSRVRRRRPVDLVAQYFDTADLGLLAERITLRRRTGGSDAGWHLKLPGNGSRVELHSPLTDDDELPADLAVYVHAILRGRPLVPVVRLTTRRTVHELLSADGGVLTEICDDRVSSESGIDDVPPQSWREWEVELVDGDAAILDLIEPVLLEIGATGDAGPAKLTRALAGHLPTPVQAPEAGSKRPTVGEVVQRYLYDEIDRLRRHDPGARLHEEDAIHQMRVAARRLRSVLSSYRDLLPEGYAQHLRTELKALATALGMPRDAEVIRDLVLELLDEQPPDRVLGPIRHRQSEQLAHRNEAAHGEAMEFLVSARYDELLEELSRLPQTTLDPAAERPAKKDLLNYFDRDWRRFRRTVRAANALPPGQEREEQLHEVRKSAKRLRYGMDSISALDKHQRTRQVAKAAAAITESLGTHNDAVVAAPVVGEIAARAHARGEDTLTYGRIEAALAGGTDESHGSYAEALKRLNALRLPDWKKL